MISTVNDGIKKVKKPKKRLSKTSILAKTIRTFFEDYARKLLDIPEFDKLYNYEISTINERNKLKRSNTCKMIYRKEGY